MTEQFSRLFTPEEANTLLDEIRPIVAEMLSTRQEILTLRPSLEGMLEKMIGNGGSRQAGELLEAFERLRAAVANIQAKGVVVKDIESGLVDFPSLREGRTVFLCWQYDEPGVTFWHDLDTGFAGRKPI
ncbi:MAG TPA: DUF2203 domain-containing protein [Anaerolineales bacterium]|jgi:hypothetical protein|nr:DUF2203 domain-containing protein [Anaerolineales bacterium]